MPLSTYKRVLALTACVAGTASWAATAQAPTVAEVAPRVDAAKQLISRSSDEIRYVETGFSQRADPTEDAERAERFSNGEIHYLLGAYDLSALIFYDLVSTKEFESNGRYGDALYYLADSLYQLKNYLGARVYLRRVLALRSDRYKDALRLTLDIASRLGEFNGIDDYINQARGLSGGTLPNELNYVYAKWLMKRTDVPAEERIPRALTILQALSTQGGTVGLQASYTLGVGQVLLRKFDAAAETFKQTVALPKRDAKERNIHQLALLSYGRVLFELGKFDDAAAAYQAVDSENDLFAEAQYELAWTQVRRKDLKRARDASELLLMVADGTTLEPDALILSGTLQLKLAEYKEAIETYNNVINKYAPVRDELDALLAVNKDPVRYFEDLLARNNRTLDVSSMLGPIAAKWATTENEVAQAMLLANTLKDGRQNVADSQEIAGRILKALEERGLEAFPLMQEGYKRADVVDNSLAQAEAAFTLAEYALLEPLLSGDERTAATAAKVDVDALASRLASLPKTEAELTARNQKFKNVVDSTQLVTFGSYKEIQGLQAELAAVLKYYEDTRNSIEKTPEDERLFFEQLDAERTNLQGLEDEIAKLRSQLDEEKYNANSVLSGEEALRSDYLAALARLSTACQGARGRAGGDVRGLLSSIDSGRSQIPPILQRSAEAKRILRDRVAKRGQHIRDMVVTEQQLLSNYGSEVNTVSSSASNLVGSITFDSFKRVRQSFYDLVLKADVGVVDVSFTRKQDVTGKIQKLASQKDHDLKQLDDEFKDVLQDAE